MVTQEDTIFVSGMDSSISEEEICQHFGAIGIIKVCVRPYIHIDQYLYHISIFWSCNLIFNSTMSSRIRDQACLGLNTKYENGDKIKSHLNVQ